MKLSINSLSKLNNPEKYTNLMDALDKNQAIITNHLNSYSIHEDYDEISNRYKKNLELYESFKTLTQNKELLMTDILEFLKIHKANFIERSNIKEVSQTLDLCVEFEKEFKSQKFQSFYAKIQESSNLVIIYDTDQKKFLKLPINLESGLKFPQRCYSLFFDKNIFYCGGTMGQQSGKNAVALNDVYTITISLLYEEFKFEQVKLAPMLTPRHSHSLIHFRIE